jgi:hypothetical protein
MSGNLGDRPLAGLRCGAEPGLGQAGGQASEAVRCVAQDGEDSPRRLDLRGQVAEIQHRGICTE